MKISQVIVVEGKKDITAIKRAVEAEIITTSGLGLTEKKIAQIEEAQKRCGVIVLTDPDYPGGKIRRIISEKIPGVSHAHLPAEKACKIEGKKYGIEYAEPEDIRKALGAVRAENKNEPSSYTREDLISWGLSGGTEDGERRRAIGEALGLGQLNSKQFLNKINAYGIKKAEIVNRIAEIERSKKIGH